jgi:hypothetical protein
MLCWAGGTGAVESTRDPAATFRGKVPHGAEAYAGAAFNATGHAALTVCRRLSRRGIKLHSVCVAWRRNRRSPAFRTISGPTATPTAGTTDAALRSISCRRGSMSSCANHLSTPRRRGSRPARCLRCRSGVGVVIPPQSQPLAWLRFHLPIGHRSPCGIVGTGDRGLSHCRE